MYTKKPRKTTYTKMYTILRGKYGIVWHNKTPPKNVNSSNYGILARYGIIINHR